MKPDKTDFQVSSLVIAYKLILGLVELALGLGIAVFGNQLRTESTHLIFRELSEDPHDLIAHFGLRILPNLFTHNTYFVVTMIFLGATKIIGVVGLAYKKYWGVTLLVGLTAVLLPFQIINLLIHRSLFDLIYTVLGIAIALYLIQFQPKIWVIRIWKSITG